ncbi:MAG: hypothetical protein AAFV45_13765 [Pseudomonadota bacterium]
MTDIENNDGDSVCVVDGQSCDQLNYILDLTLELHRMAAKAGYAELAGLLMQAYENGRRDEDVPSSVDRRFG